MNPIEQFLQALMGGGGSGGLLGGPDGDRLQDPASARVSQAFDVTAGGPQGGMSSGQARSYFDEVNPRIAALAAAGQLPQNAPVPSARPEQAAEAAPGEIRQGPDGQTYQYAETRGMAGASGPYGWIPVNTGSAQSQQPADPYLAWQRGMGSGDEGPMPSQGRRVAGGAGNQAMAGGSGGDRLQGAPSGGGLGGLLGQFLNPGGQGRNRTVEWLTSQGMDPGMATVIASDRDMLRSYLGSSMKGSSPDWQMQTIYDDKGNEQRVLMDMNNPSNVRPVGGSKTNLMTPEEIQQKKDIAAAGKTDVKIDNGKLTEQQSKDVGFYSRGLYALDDLSSLDNNLTSGGGYLASQGGVLGNYFKEPNYRLAEAAGKDFLAIILRKDTGAAVTPQEFNIYGQMYLPWPGDKKADIEAKRLRRDRALKGIRRGLGTAGPLADDIDQQFQAEKNAAPPAPTQPADSGVIDYQDYFGAR